MRIHAMPAAAAVKLALVLLAALSLYGCVGSITPPSTTQTPPPNTAPVANAGADQTVAVATPVILNGSASLDAEKDPLTYAWTLTTLPTGSKAALTRANEAIASFVPDLPGIYIATLAVSDGKLNSAATVAVTATGPAPVYSSNLGLALAVSEAAPAIGQTVVVSFTVANAGPDPAESVTVIGGLPMGLDYVLASPAVGSYDAAGNEWKIGTLAAGAKATMNLALTLISPLTQTYGAVVVTSTKDLNTANDRASVTIANPQPLTGCADWSEANAYTAGQCVTYQGNTYVAKWWSKGEVPGSSAKVAWSLVGPVGGTSAATPLCPAWSATIAFTVGHCAIHQDNTYLAKWWTQGETPGATPSGPWQLHTPVTAAAGSQCPQWTADAVFTTGQCAFYQGKEYKSKWWTQGDVPSNVAGGPWSLIGSAN